MSPLTPVYVVGGLTIFASLLALIAPQIAKRWPGSWLDVSAAFLLRVLPEVIFAIASFAKGRGLTAPLVITKADDQALEASARRAYEAFGDASNWHKSDGSTLPQWDHLARAQRESWKAASATMQKLIAPREVKPLPPPPFTGLAIVALVCACTPADRDAAIKTAIDAAPIIAGAACSEAPGAKPGFVRFLCKVADGMGATAPQGSGAPPSGDLRPKVRGEITIDVPAEQVEAFKKANPGQ